MPDLTVWLRPLRHPLSVRAFSRAAALLLSDRRLAAGILAAMLLALLPRATPAQAVRSSAPLPVFQGPTRGVAATQTPLGTDFSTLNASQANAVAGHAAGATIPVGAAVHSTGSGGEALLYLSAPGAGHFKASFAIADDDPSGLKLSTVRLLVLGRAGFTIHFLDVSAKKGVVMPIDIEVSGGIALAIDFLTTAQSYIYTMSLTGTAKVLRPVPLTGGGMVAGATPLAASAIIYSCSANAAPATQSVSRVTIPFLGTYNLLPCGMLTVKLLPGATGTLVVRYGTNDLWNYTSVPAALAMRVLDGSGHLLRKAVGLTYSGSGLQSLWADVKGGNTVTLALVGPGPTVQVVLTGLSLINRSFVPHPNPNHEEFGSPSGSSEAIAPDALVTRCNAGVGNSDITVNQLVVIRDTYLIGTGCGVAELIMTDAHGAFHARLGVNDADITGQAASVSLAVLDQNSHPLFHAVARASRGRPGVPVSLKLDGGSILQIQFTGPVVLYDLTLTGHATVYNRVFASSEPPVTIPGGVAIDPRGFMLACTVQVTTSDTLLIHEAALEQWSLNGSGCGSATLDLRKLPYAHHFFGARFGIAAVNQTEGIAHLHVAVLDAGGKAVDHVFTARSGYGPQPLRVGLAGGVTLRLTWSDAVIVVFAMTTS